MDGVAQQDEGLAGDSWLSPAGTGRPGCELRDPRAAGQEDEAGEGRGPVQGRECQREEIQPELVANQKSGLDVLWVREGHRGLTVKTLGWPVCAQGVAEPSGPGWSLLSCRRSGLTLPAPPAQSLSFPSARPQPVAFPFYTLLVSTPPRVLPPFLPSFLPSAPDKGPECIHPGYKGLTTTQSEACPGICRL